MNERPVKINRQRWFSISIYKFNLSLDLYCTNQVRSQDFTSGVGEVGESYEGALCLLKKVDDLFIFSRRPQNFSSPWSVKVTHKVTVLNELLY